LQFKYLVVVNSGRLLVRLFVGNHVSNVDSVKTLDELLHFSDLFGRLLHLHSVVVVAVATD
jgi:hypothetical protein